MKKSLVVLASISMFLLFAALSCTPPPPPPVETQPTDTKPPVTNETTTEPVTEPEVRQVEDADFRTVYFDFDRAEIKSEYESDLAHNAQLLKDNPTATVRIEGHCDERGTVEYNLALGERRANSTRSYLIDLGVSANRLETVSFGKERPAIMGHDETAWGKNRRAEFRVTTR